MKRYILLSVLIAILVCFPGPGSADQAPSKIAGLTLGEKIANFVQLVQMETAMPIRYQEYLRVVQTRDLDGYKSGTVEFGDCLAPGRVVRIKLKYEDPEKKFFNELLKRFKKKFGEPDEWRGDPFHVIMAWKWSFRDKDNNSISLILQHSMDEEQKFGNSVKLTNTTFMEKERSCYERKHPESAESSKRKSTVKKKLTEADYQRFIPE